MVSNIARSTVRKWSGSISTLCVVILWVSVTVGSGRRLVIDRRIPVQLLKRNFSTRLDILGSGILQDVVIHARHLWNAKHRNDRLLVVFRLSVN